MPRYQSEEEKTQKREMGSRIRTARLSTGTTQEKLGEAIGISFQMIQKYERGDCRVPSGRLVKIARALNTSIDFLLLGRDKMAKGEKVPLTMEEFQQQARYLQKVMEKQHPSSANLVAARHALNTWLMLIKTP